MLIKNKKNILIIFLLSFFFNIQLSADEFDIQAKEIIVDKENQIITGVGSVIAKDNEGKIINANKITYTKSEEFLLAEGDVKIYDNQGNTLITEKATYDKKKEKVITYDISKLSLDAGYTLNSKNISYDMTKKILRSDQNTIVTDLDGNIISTSMFQYDALNNLFSSIGEIKIVDVQKNKYFFKEIYIDTKKKEMIGSDISIILDEVNFGLKKENDPRLAANSVLITKNKSELSKGIFTVCQKREDDKCPPWTIKAKKITYDKIKKNIYYDHATLKIYDVPVFYFPKFFHPDPSVKRQSGLLFPSYTNTSLLGSGIATPYYWAMNRDKDMTFTPKFLRGENILYLNEYRQSFKNGFLTLDTSYTEGFKDTTTIKTKGSRSHIFADLNINLNDDETYEESLEFLIQQTSKNTYFRQYSIDTALVSSENTNLENKFKYSLNKENSFIDIEASLYEDLRKNDSARYEYMLPNVLFGKTYFSENLGLINFTSNTYINKYEKSNNLYKEKKFLVNDLTWTPLDKITKKGFVNSVEGIFRNTNYKARNTDKFKNAGTINEIQSAISFKSSLPMKKDGINYSNIFSPKYMLRYAPGHMRDLNDSYGVLNYTNLYSLNKTNEIENGLSAILGFEFKTNKKIQNNQEIQKFSLSLGQVFNIEENTDLPSQSSLDQKTSDIVGEMGYNFSEIGSINYKFSIDDNLNDLVNSEISTAFDFGALSFNLDYLEQNKHRGTEHYVSSGITLNYNDSSEFNFSTKKNFKTDSTEYYDWKYQYQIDCLTAGLLYRREFYHDSDLDPNDSLMFTVTFVPFGTINSPVQNP